MFLKLFCLLSGAVLAGCGPGQQDAPAGATPSSPAPPISQISNGYFYGTANVDGFGRYIEALLTVDGAIHMHIGGCSNGAFDPEASMQLVGRIATTGATRSGTGIVIGQHCAFNPGPFCAAPASAEIHITDARQDLLSGEIRVTMNDAAQTWPFRMRWPTHTYLNPATLDFAEGQYQETLAEFANGEAVTINVDGAGAMFFQSAATGCVGNGALAPYLSGEFNVYDVTLTIENCTGAYVYMNGEFEGLATRAVGAGPNDDRGSWLLIWLSSSDPTTSPVAMTMWGNDSACGGCWDLLGARNLISISQVARRTFHTVVSERRPKAAGCVLRKLWKPDFEEGELTSGNETGQWPGTPGCRFLVSDCDKLSYKEEQFR